MPAAIEVVATGQGTTVQDLGRPGYAAWGIAPGGAADRASLRLANRLVGNPDGAAALEVLLGGLALRFRGAALVAVTGAPAAVRLDGAVIGNDGPRAVRAGSLLEIGPPPTQLRSYLAVRGGLDTEVVLGSRAVDEAGGIGRALRPGDVLPVGSDVAASPSVDHAPRSRWPDGPVHLHGTLGPRDDWFTDGALARLVSETYTVAPASNRIGVRLSGPPLERRCGGELLSEPTVRGAVEVPTDGLPIIFAADHPTTCGYPVVAVLDPGSADHAAQCRPGQTVRFRLRRPEIRITGADRRGGYRP